MHLAVRTIRAVLMVAVTLCLVMGMAPLAAHGLGAAPQADTGVMSVHAEHMTSSTPAVASPSARVSRIAGRTCCPGCDSPGLRPGCCAIGHCSGTALLPFPQAQRMVLASKTGYGARRQREVQSVTLDLPSPPPR